MRRAILIGFLVILAIQGHTQSIRLESELLTKLDSLTSLRDSLNTRNTSLSVIEAIKKLPTPSDSLNALFNLQISTSFYDMKDYDSAKWYLLKAESILKETSFELLLIQVYDRLGVVVSDFGDNNLAIEYYQKALEIADASISRDAKVWSAKINGNIGGIYYDFEDYEKALEYATKANDINDQYDLGRPNGVYQMQMGLSNLGLENFALAEEQLTNSVNYFEENFNPLFLQYGYINVARVYLELNQLDEAEESLQKTIALTDSIGSLAESATISELMSEVHFRRGQFNQSMQYALRSLEISLQYKMKMKEVHAYNMLYKIDSARGNFREALNYRNKHIHLSDSIKSQETFTKVAELETKYETQKKEREIEQTRAELEEKEQFQFFLMIVIALILLISIGGYILLHQRYYLKQRLLSEEINNLRLQLNAFLGHENQEMDIAIDSINEKLETPLTDREFTILQLAMSDKNNKQIAETAFVSVNTVKFHLKNIYDKLGVSNRKEVFEFIISPD